ncbi:intracellular sulfur oxidation protein DsrF [bacterium BMS3Bbin07]|nr:intracellular sulfur oxidation protein DsrF [bacterium BMS3Bbin07]
MGDISIILRRPPYGTVDASEAIRHALGGVVEDYAVKLILVDGGVNAARRNQDTSGTEYMNAGEGIRDCIDMGVDVYADKLSLKDSHLEADEIEEGIIIASSSEIAELVKESDTTIIF